MKINSLILSALSAIALLASSCDDGSIWPDEAVATVEGRVVKLTATLETGVGNWPADHNLVLAGFVSETADVASIVKNIPTSSSGRIEVVLAGIPKEVGCVQLCITGRLRNRLYVLASIDCPDTRDTIRMDVPYASLSMLGVLKSQLFGQRCAGCHGQNGFFGLNLTEGDIRPGIVGRRSKADGSTAIVQPGKPEESLLYTILADTAVSSRWKGHGAQAGLFGGIGYDHVGSVASSAPELYRLLHVWIEGGAQ